MNNFPTITLQIHPRCNHRTLDKSCIYCADAQRVFREVLDMQKDSMGSSTKIQVIASSNDPIERYEKI